MIVRIFNRSLGSDRGLIALMGLLLILLGSSAPARADFGCGMYCFQLFDGAGVCLSGGDPTTGCGEWWPGCISGPSPQCGGDPGCGFGGHYCPNYQIP